MIKCVMCPAPAAVIVSWPVKCSVQQHTVCAACGQSLWDKISTEFNNTEAHLCFSIMPLKGEQS